MIRHITIPISDSHKKKKTARVNFAREKTRTVLQLKRESCETL